MHKLYPRRRFPFFVATKGVRLGHKVMVNCGLTMVVAYARHGKLIN
jgi:hypothetical protein